MYSVNNHILSTCRKMRTKKTLFRPRLLCKSKCKSKYLLHDGPHYSRVWMVSASESASNVTSVMNISIKFGLFHIVVVEQRFPTNLLNCSENLLFTTLSTVGSFGFTFFFKNWKFASNYARTRTWYFCPRTYYCYLEKCFARWQWRHVIYRLVQNHGKFNMKRLKLYFKNFMLK